MSTSSSAEEFKELISLLKNNDNDKNHSYILLKTIMEKKFSETKTIFSAFNINNITTFVNECCISYYTDGDTIFSKGDDCNDYFFLINGDIELFSDEKSVADKPLKTISGGLVFGHKVQNKLPYYAYGQSKDVQLLTINKEKFNLIVEDYNKKNLSTKFNFLKKFFPRFRKFSEADIKKLEEYFFKFEYNKGSRLVIDGEFNDSIYIILNGKCLASKEINTIDNYRELIESKNIYMTHVVLESYRKYFNKIRKGRYNRSLFSNQWNEREIFS